MLMCRDERRIAFQQIDGIHRRSLGLVARQLLDVLERIPIKPARAKHALGEPPPALGALFVAQRRLLSRRGGAQNRMPHDSKSSARMRREPIGRRVLGVARRPTRT